MAVCDLTVDVGSQPLDPATHLPLINMVYNDKVLEQRFAEDGSLNFFNPEVDESWKNNLSVAQSVRIRYKNYRNPFNNVGVTQVQYDEDNTCPPTMSDQCDPGCISSENSWRYADIRFKNKFRVGVSWCVESEKLLYQDADSRWSESIGDSQTVISTVGWSELICQSIASPATKKLPTFTLSANHYFDAGAADQYDTMTLVFNYMQRLYGNRWTAEFMTVADAQFELDIIGRGSDLHAWNSTGIATVNGNVDAFAAGGFRAMPALPRLWNMPILIAPDVVAYYPTDGALAGQNLNPFANADNSKYYVVIASKRSFYHGAVSLMDKHYFPATCDNKYDSIQQTWLS